MYESYKQKEEALRREMHMEEEKLEARMEYAKYEHETELLRERKLIDIFQHYPFPLLTPRFKSYIRMGL